MQKARIIFGRNKLPFGLLIQLFTLSRWSHVGVLDNGYVVDTTLFSGVRKVKLSEWISHYPTYSITELPINNYQERIEWLNLQVGKPYDLSGIISFLFRNNIQSKDKWFCSELVAYFLGIEKIVWRLSPQFIWMLAKITQGWIK